LISKQTGDEDIIGTNLSLADATSAALVQINTGTPHLPRRSYTTTTGTVGVWTDVGELEDVDAVFVFNADFEPADPDTGAFEDEWTITGEIKTITIGDLILTRDQMRDMSDAGCVHQGEYNLAEEVQTGLESGEATLDSYARAPSLAAE